MTADDHTFECPHSAACGACSLLGRPYRKQLESKRALLIRTLEKTIRVDRERVLPTLASPQRWEYRNRAKMVISSDRDRVSSLGYFQPGSRRVVDTPNCGVLVPAVLETTRRLRNLLNTRGNIPFRLRHIDLRCGTDPKQQHLTLVIKDKTLPDLPFEAVADASPHIQGLAFNLNPDRGPQVIKGRIEPVLGVREVFVTSAGLDLRVSPGSFFQVNLSMLPEIHGRLGTFLDGGRLLVDLYAGVGTHGLAMRNRFRKVLCVEGVRSAVADTRDTISRGRVNNVDVHASPVQRSLKRLKTLSPDAFVLNPSRTGTDRATLAAIVASRARRVAYLSCEPATLGRDLAVLIRGGFNLVSAQAVDMMPHTRQVESLALLQR